MQVVKKYNLLLQRYCELATTNFYEEIVKLTKFVRRPNDYRRCLLVELTKQRSIEKLKKQPHIGSWKTRTY